MTLEELRAFQDEIEALSAERLGMIEVVDRLTVEVSEMQARLRAMLAQADKEIEQLELQAA